MLRTPFFRLYRRSYGAGEYGIRQDRKAFIAIPQRPTRDCMLYTDWIHLENSASILEVWQWGQQWADVYWDILKMALEHPQKQYRCGQDDGQICIILSSHGQGIYLLHSLLCSKEKFTTSCGGTKKTHTGLSSGLNNYDKLQNYKMKLVVARVFTNLVLHQRKRI